MSNIPRIIKRVMRYSVWALAAVGVLAVGALFAFPLLLIPDSFNFDKRAGQVTVNARGWLVKASRPAEDVIETALLRLKRQSIDVASLVDIGQKQGTIAADPARPRLMLADRNGKFFEIDLKDATPVVKELPLRLQLREAELLEYAAGRGVVENSLMRVWKLLILKSGKLVASYTQWDPEKKCAALKIGIRDLSDDWSANATVDWTVVYQSQPCLPLHLGGGRLFAGHQAGGRLVEAGPDTVLLSVGDFLYDGVNFTPDYPQDAAVDYGKVFEVNIATGEKKMISLGHRNPQGLARDSTGRIWETEHGPQGGDELNLIQPGKNYGWPLVTLGTNYGRTKWALSSNQGRHDGFEVPRFSWTPSVGVSNALVVSGFAPEWDGDLLVCSLEGGSLFRVRLDGDHVVYVEPIRFGTRLRDITQLHDGRIAVWTDNGDLIVLAPGPADTAFEERLAALDEHVKPVVESCMQCHSFAAGGGDEADGKINLRTVYGRKIGAGSGPSYSGALAQWDGHWDSGTLDEFLADPQKKVPGTSMTFPGIQDEKLRKKIVEFLRDVK